MSKLSPYRRTRKDLSPSPLQRPELSRLVDKFRTGKSILPNDFKQEELYRHTEKKRHQMLDIEAILDRNKHLTAENAELYSMLEERGHIVATLERKMQQQIEREVGTLEQIQYEKNIFMKDQQVKITKYEDRIDALLSQIHQLNAEKQCIARDASHLQSIAAQQASARGLGDLERAKVRNIVGIKNQQIIEMEAQYRAHNERLRHELQNANGQILHLTQMHKIKCSQMKMQYENIIEGLEREFSKEREALKLQNEIEVRRVATLLSVKQAQAEKLDDQIRLTHSQNNVREQQLLEKKMKLENQIAALEGYHKESTFAEVQRLKELNKFEVEALQKGNEAQSNNLKGENSKLIFLTNAKADEIQSLYRRIEAMRQEHSLQNASNEALIDSLRQKIEQMERTFQEDEEIFKIKMAELREADLRSLRQYYEHEIEMIEKQLADSQFQAEKNRKQIHFELQQKKELRKRFDVEVTDLQAKIAQLEHRLSAMMLEKREDMGKANSQIDVTSCMLIREAKEKEKYTQISEEEKKKLHRLLESKDGQIEELNAKMMIMKEHHASEVTAKNHEIDLVKNSKEQVETELRKQKCFYDNELKRKDALIKSNKECHENEFQKMKKITGDQYEGVMKEATAAKSALELEISKLKCSQKRLADQLSILKEHKEAQGMESQVALEEEKTRLIKKHTDENSHLHEYYKAEIAKLRTQIDDQQRQLNFKEEDLRNIAEKYHKLEEKLGVVMQSQDKLKTMENKIMAMGQENNLVKNLTEIIRNRKK